MTKKISAHQAFPKISFACPSKWTAFRSRAAFRTLIGPLANVGLDPVNHATPRRSGLDHQHLEFFQTRWAAPFALLGAKYFIHRGFPRSRSAARPLN